MASEPTFPDEIMAEILLKLPIKSILRCTTLSKHYYSLIHSQYFTCRHLNLERLTNKLNDRLIVSPMSDSFRLFNRKAGCFTELECPSSLNDNYDYEVIISGPINGLYCVIDQENVFRRPAITLWNPATLEELILPVPPLTNDNSESLALAELTLEDLFFTPEECLACGFGYDSNTNNYKVVIIYGSFLDLFNKMFMYIFNASERTWRYHEGVNSWTVESFAGVFVSGACHWICTVPQGGTIALGFQILAFDMSIESSKAISFPDVGDGYAWSNTSIATLNECLALINACGEDLEGRCSSFNVWVMAEHDVTESWSMMYRISLSPGIDRRYLGITGDRLYVREGEGWLVSYDLNSQDVECYGIRDYSICSLLPFEKSLVRIISS